MPNFDIKFRWDTLKSMLDIPASCEIDVIDSDIGEQTVTFNVTTEEDVVEGGKAYSADYVYDDMTPALRMVGLSVLGEESDDGEE